MDESWQAYDRGRADGVAAHRDPARTADPDYRIGFLDGRLEVFRMHAALRKIRDES